MDKASEFNERTTGRERQHPPRLICYYGKTRRQDGGRMSKYYCWLAGVPKSTGFDERFGKHRCKPTTKNNCRKIHQRLAVWT